MREAAFPATIRFPGEPRHSAAVLARLPAALTSLAVSISQLRQAIPTISTPKSAPFSGTTTPAAALVAAIPPAASWAVGSALTVAPPGLLWRDQQAARCALALLLEPLMAQMPATIRRTGTIKPSQ